MAKRSLGIKKLSTVMWLRSTMKAKVVSTIF